MTTKNYGPSSSGYLDPTGRAWETVVFEMGKPVLDREFNLGQDIDGGAGESALLRAMPSGWISTDFLDTANSSDAIFTFNASSLLWTCPALLAHVNGWLITVNNTGFIGFNELNLPAGPVGVGTQRTDIVVLEVWRMLISAAPDVTGKSVLGNIWRYGNVKTANISDALLNYPDDLYDTNVGQETTKRVQIQYRLRVISSVDVFAYPNGLDDPSVVANSIPTAPLTPDGVATLFPYANQSASGDAGLWVAGDGNPANTLGTVDGYMYAIPLLGIFRRNVQAFDKNTNQNGGVASPGPSDRPDGLFYDVVVADDVADLRNAVNPIGWDYNEVVEKAMNLLFNNTSKTEWTLTGLGGGVAGHTPLYANEIGVLPGDGINTGDTPGATFIGQFDAVRRRFSDRATYETAIVAIPAPGGAWTPGVTFTIDPTALLICANPDPAAPPAPPYVAFNWASRAPTQVVFTDILAAMWMGSAAGKTTADASSHFVSVTGLGACPITSLTFTMDALTGLGLTDEYLYVFVTVAYPPGQGLTLTPTEDFGSNSVVINNPGQLPAASPIYYNAIYAGFDFPHREVDLEYTTLSITVDLAADTQTALKDYFIMPERVSAITAILRNGVAFAGGVTIDSTGIAVHINNAGDRTSPGDVLTVTYNAQRPLPQNSEQLTVWYKARAPQTIHSSIAGLSMTVVPRYIAPYVHTMTVGSGSQDEAYPFPYQYVQTPGVYPTSASAFTGEHELSADSDIDVATFNAATGLLRLPVYIGYTPDPEAVTFDRGLGDIDAEGRTFYKSVPGGAYIPNTYAQPLSDPKKHKVLLPMLVELPTDGTIGKQGQLLLVVLQRWAVFDEENSIAFESDLTLNTTSASVFRLKGNLLNKR